MAGTPAAVGAAAAATGAAAAAAAATAAGRCRSRPAAGAAELNWFEAAPSAAADKGFALFGLTTGPSYTGSGGVPVGLYLSVKNEKKKEKKEKEKKEKNKKKGGKKGIESKIR